MLGKPRIGPGIKFLDLYSPYADGLKTGFICASGFNIVGSAVRDGRRLIAVAFGFRRADLRDEFVVRLLDEAFALKTGGNRPKIWQVPQRRRAARPRCSRQSECGIIRYDMPGDAAWLGTYRDWRTARHAFDVGQAELAKLGFTRLGKEYILPVTSNKLTRQAAIIADLEPAAAQKLCADYQAAQAVLPGQEAAGLRLAVPRLLALNSAVQGHLGPPRRSCHTAAHELADQFRPAQAARPGLAQGDAGESLAEMPQVRADAVRARLGGQPGGLQPLRPSHAHPAAEAAAVPVRRRQVRASSAAERVGSTR